MVISKRVRKWLAAGLAMLITVGNVFPAVHTAQAAPDNNAVVISQVYGGGGNGGAPYKNDFIELYNPTNSSVDLSGWKVRYASLTGAFSNTTELKGTIPANGYYLIQEAAGTNNAASLPIPDIIGEIAMSGTGGKVDLVNGSGERLDLISYGPTASDFEGKPAPALTNSTSAIRKAHTLGPVDNRGLDTDNNLNDFTVESPSPRNSSYGQAPEAPTAAAPVVASPAPNAWPVGTSISLSSPTVGASVYAAVYGNGGTRDYQLFDQPIQLIADTGINAFASAPGLADSPVANFVYSVLYQSTIPATRVMEKGQNVWTKGIVTHIDGAEMYIQDGDAGIVLYGFPAFANIGDEVEASGVMEIYNGLQEIKPQAGLSQKVITPNVGVPAPKLITAADLSTANGEKLEAQLVTMENVTIVKKAGSTVTAKQGDQEFTIYSPLSKLDPGTSGKTFERITGVIKQFNTTYQFIPLNENALVEETLSVMASPGAGRIITGSKVTLSSPAAGAEIFYTTNGTDPTAASTKYTAPIVVNQNVTIKAIAVAGGQTSKVYTFAYTPSEAPRIHDIQGETHKSEFDGQTVTDIEGIVTQYGYTFANGSYKGFFIQDPKPDNNPNTSEGIFVYSTNASKKPAVGDFVAVTGVVSEYNEGSSTNLTSTQITLTDFKQLPKTGVSFPEPVVLGKGGRVIPTSVLDNRTEFQSDKDAIDFYESLEGMLVKLPSPTILSPYWTSGNGTSQVYNIATRIDNGTEDAITPAGGLALTEYKNYNPQRLLIAYSNPGQEVGTGDTFNGDITGVIGYNNGNFKVIPEYGKLPSITTSPFKQETSTIEVNADKLLIASYNIENYYPGVGDAKTKKLAESITANMKKPDIIGVVEMQDSNGETDNGTVEANATPLIQAIQAAGGPVYKYIDIAPQDKKDGGAPGGNIRVGFLYNPERVELADSVNGQKGTSTQSVGYDKAADKLTYNPGRIDPTNEAFTSSRKPLAAQFIFRGEKVIVIANHFNSKGGDTAPFGSTQPPVLSSETQRHKIAAVVNGFVKQVLTANPDANIVALGDLNDFQFTPTATILKGDELDNLIDKLPLNEQYTYTYDGNSQVLDHILVSKKLTASADVDVIHLNADFPSSRGRVSDHDAVMAQIDVKATGDFPLRILHTNDTHSHLETVVKRMTAIKQERTPNTLLLDAGDVFSGTLYYTKFEGLADLEFMNYIGYDAMTFGNHEFDNGLPTLKKFIDKANFPFVSSNIDFTTKDNELKGNFKNEIGGLNSSIENSHIYPAIIKEVNGQKVGIFGLTTEDTVGLASPGDNIAFLDYKTSAANTVKMLQDQGINKIIALSHLGYTVDEKLAVQVPGIDVIVGGHSHTKLDAPVIKNKDTEPTLILQTGEYGQNLGELDVKFNDKGVITSYQGKLLDVSKFADDATAKTMLAKYDAELTEIRNTKVGNTNVELSVNRVIDGKSVRVVRQEETAIGNLIADGVNSKSKELVSKLLSPTELSTIKGFVSIQNGGGIRAGINKGTITLGDVLTVMPFSNSLVALKVTGQEIIESLENGVSGLESDQGRFAQVSGMKYTYDSKKKPEIINPTTNVLEQKGERMVSVEIKQADGSYAAIDPKGYYILSTNSFMAGGGDFYRSLAKAKADGRYYELYLPDYEVFTDYLKQHGDVNMGLEGRITDQKGAVPSPKPTEIPTETPAPTPSPAPEKDFPLRILHTNDTHSHLETVVKRMTAIKQERTDNSILLDAGDVFSGTLYFTKFEGLADLEFMNYIGYDAMTFGNHEFDKGLPTLKNFIDEAKFPFVSSNIDFTTKNNELKGNFKNEIGGLNASVQNGHIYPAIIKEVNGQKVGIFGLTTEDTVGLASPGDNIAFLDYKTSAANTVKMLQDQGINKIIALSHLGYTVDEKLAVQVPGIDVIVGGHSHTKLDAPVITNKDSEPTLIVQTGEYGQNLGELDVNFNDKGVITSYKGKLLDVSKFADDAKAKEMLKDYDAKLEEVRKTKVGKTNVELDTNRIIDGKSVRVVRQEETVIGNLIADGVNSKSKELVSKLLSPEEQATIKGFVSIQNGGGIRVPIKKGDIFLGDVLSVMPFSNSLVALKVTGQEIIESLENGVSGLESDQGRFAQVSGMKYTYDSKKKPEIINPTTNVLEQKGERMVSVEIKQADGSYVAIDPKGYYILSTNSFMAGGGDFYRSLAKAKADGRYYELYLPDFEVFTEYLGKIGEVNMELEGRITDLKGSQAPGKEFPLRILHTNDTHSHLETVVKRMTAIKQERTDNSILLDAGDVFSGTLYFTKFEGLADLEFMNYIGYDAMTFGNHEFDKGLPTLKTFVDKANFPIVSSNIDFTTKDNELKGNFKNEIGGLNASVQNGHIYPAIIKEVNGQKVGIFGLTTEDTVGLASPGDNIAFLDYKTSAANTVKMLQDQGINKIIALSHLGYTVDEQLAVQVPGIDVIVGGHSHTKLDAPVIKNKDTEPTLILQTGEYGQNLGELDVNFNDKGVITSYKGKLLDVNKFADDATAKSMLEKYDKELTEIRGTQVGKTNVELSVNREIDGKSTRVVRKEETAIGNLIADGVNSKSKELVTKLLSSDDLATIKGFVSIQNGGGIRAGINKGNISLGDVLTVMPFSNSLVALKVTGQEIIESLENGVSGLESDQGRFAQVSGMKYTYDSSKKPEIINPTTNVLEQKGERMVSVEIKQADGSYVAIDPKGYYILSTNSFMAGGGDFYRSLAKAKADGRYYELYLPDYEVFTDYLKQIGDVNIALEGRIKDLKGAVPTPETSPTPSPTPVPTSPSGGSGSTPAPTATASATTSPTAAPSPAATQQVTTITPSELTAQLAKLPAGSNELVIPVTASAGGAQIVLPGSVIVAQAAAQPNTILTFTAGSTSYSMPVSIIKGAALANQLGTSDFTVTVSMTPADSVTLSSVNSAAAQQGSITLAGPVIEFSVTAQAGTKNVPVNSFGSTYVKRTITVPGALNAQNATAVVFDQASGQLIFVPSVFTAKADGTTEVTITRNSNSIYTVIQSSKSFGDTAGHWAKSSIDLLASKQIVSGTSSTTFSPSQSVSRAEFAALITRALGLETVSGGTTFSDVSSSKWYAGAIQTASAAGLISGYTDGTFRPDSQISRQEMAAVLAKAIKYTGATLNADPAVLAKFSDAAGIPAWSREAVAEIAAAGIIQGTPDGAFAPQKAATRAEAVTMLEKTLKSLHFIN
ncbi:5'-nucleotidase C-terminal domain-containing protein [Paenibacillus sp. NPDC058177]|uniref:5'-nucleotidase C-terminal domain-containing protein n=1 Tax=Paenibacillus sp. NPDC058177 TaxID=3346369 RepID=UPI0036DBE7E4